MRLLSFLLLSGFALVAFAANPVPAKLEPLPPPPAMNAEKDNAAAPEQIAAQDTPAAQSSDSEDEPQVTITKEAEQTVEEFRAGGRLYMIKITPKHGKPYYLVDDRGDGKFSRQESLDTGFRPPRWVIHKF